MKTQIAKMELPGGTIAVVTEDRVKLGRSGFDGVKYAVTFDGGFHDDGEAVKTYGSMREAFQYLATVAEQLADEQ